MEENDELKSPYELFGVECGEGWKDIIQPLFNYVEEYNKEHQDSSIEILQVKEKWGELFFYVSHEDRKLCDMINDAEAESWKTCECCGSKENIVHTDGWIMTICKDCLKKLSSDSKRVYSFWENIEGTWTHYICNKEEIKEVKQ